MFEKPILTFNEVWHLGVFPILIGVDEVSRFFNVRYSPGQHCRFNEDEILAFEKQARRDFDVPCGKRPPIAMVLIPSRVLSRGNAKVEVDLWDVAGGFGLTPVFDLDAFSISSSLQIDLEARLNKNLRRVKNRHLVIMTYFLPNPAFIDKEASAQKRIVGERQEEILNLPEAVFCSMMLKIGMGNLVDFGQGDENPRLLRLTRNTFRVSGALPGADQKEPVAFDFDVGFCFDSEYRGIFCSLINSDDRRIVICAGKVAHLP